MANLHSLSDEELLRELRALELTQRTAMAGIIEHLIEIEQRRLHLRRGYSSLFEYCTAALGLSEDEAYRRIAVARLAAHHPAILPGLADGSFQLSQLVQLKPHLCPENAAELLEMARGVSRRELGRRLAVRFPQADAPEILESARGRVDPLSAHRYRVQLTIGQSTRDKLERALELMSHSNPSHSLERLVDSALDELIAKLEKQTCRRPTGTASRAKSPAPARATRHVPRPLRRAVFARAELEEGGERCSFVGDQGHRCESRHFLEVDHVTPWAIEHRHRPENLRLLCRAHNRLVAEELGGLGRRSR